MQGVSRSRGVAWCLLCPRNTASHARPMSEPITPEEVLALLIPEAAAAGAPSAMATAVVRDEDGALQLRSVVPNRHMLSRALVAGRVNDGTPIIDRTPARSSATSTRHSPSPEPRVPGCRALRQSAAMRKNARSAAS